MGVVTKLEQETGLIARDEKHLPKKSVGSAKEFSDFVHENYDNFVSINWDDRTKFLKDNGYKLTRQNLIDGDLSAKPKKKK